VARYVDGAKRYKSGTWPKKQFRWFDPSASVVHFDTPQTPTPQYAGPCQGCPSQGGPGRPGAPNDHGFVAVSNGGGVVPLA
jgi:hypothetical protein